MAILKDYSISTPEISFIRTGFFSEKKYKLEPSFSINIQKVPQTSKSQEISYNYFLSVDINEKSSPTFPFKLRAVVVATYIFENDSIEKDIIGFLKTNGTSILFPFLRALVSNMTALCDVPTVKLRLINPAVFFETYYKPMETSLPVDD